MSNKSGGGQKDAPGQGGGNTGGGGTGYNGSGGGKGR